MSNQPDPAVDAPSQAPAPKLMHHQTGISVPVVDRPVHRTIEREEWVPEGMPAEDGQHVNKTSPLYYVEHVGRAGVLAAALGVGAAIAGTTGVASAAPAKADSTTSAPSTTSAVKGSSAAENTAKTTSRNAGPTRANPTTSSSSTTSETGGRTSAENTTRNDSRTDTHTTNRHTTNRHTDSRSETTETESAGAGSDEAAPNETSTSEASTTDTSTLPTTPAADTPSETVELPSAPAQDHSGPSTATDGTTESAAAESAPQISTVPQTPAPVGAVEQVAETVVVPLASPTSPATPTVQAAQTPLLWKIFPWARHTQTSSATTTPAQVADASRTAAVASSTATVAVASSTATAVPKSVGIKLPASATVFTIRGRGFGALTPDRMNVEYGGIFSKAPYTMQALPYEQWGLTAIADGVKILDAALMSTSGNIIVMSHSEGSEIASRWIRQYADDPTRAAMASRLTFLMSGNPLRPDTGYAIGRHECDGVIGVGTPTDSPWSIIDVARRWDGWADAPADTTNQWAAAEAKAGMTNSHMWYSKVDLYSSQNTVWQDGNTTMVLTHEDKLQILKKYRNPPADFVAAVRAKVEAGYNRPSTDSSSANIQAPVQIQSAQWQATFDKLVLQYGA